MAQTTQQFDSNKMWETIEHYETFGEHVALVLRHLNEVL